MKLKNPDLILGLLGCMVGYRDNAEIRKVASLRSERDVLVV